MSNIGVHDFEIPHELVSPRGDIAVIRIPRPPQKIGSIHVPGVTRDLAQHNTMAGVIISMGSLAFTEKHADGVVRPVRVWLDKERTESRDPAVGDWAVFRPFAGTMVQGGQLMASFGYRYMSTFNDVLGVVAPHFMPDVKKLTWDDANPAEAQEELKFPVAAGPEPVAELPVGVRERVTYKPDMEKARS